MVKKLYIGLMEFVIVINIGKIICEMTAKILRDKFEEDLKSLQDICPHVNAEWMPWAFAPGHYSQPVLVCDVCEKVVETKMSEPSLSSVSVQPSVTVDLGDS